MAFDLTKAITVNGETFQPHELSQTTLLVHGVQPTEFEKYVYVNILAQHRNVKVAGDGKRSYGNAQAEYRYNNLEDLPKFGEVQYPAYFKVVTAKTADKKGNIVDVVLYVDFADVTSLSLVPQKQISTVDSVAVPKGAPAQVAKAQS